MRSILGVSSVPSGTSLVGAFCAFCDVYHSQNIIFRSAVPSSGLKHAGRAFALVLLHFYACDGE